MKLSNVCLVIFILSLTSCSGISIQKPTTPDECKSSLIYPVKSEWTIGAGVVKIGVLEIVKRNPELRRPILDVLEGLKYILGNDATTYIEFAYVVITNIEELNKYVDGTSLLAASAIVTDVFTIHDLSIDRCDRDLLLRDVSQLSLWVGMV
jgi:hypothetical protein